MSKKMVYCAIYVLFSVTAAIILISCCDDKKPNLPVSNIPIDEITCDMINILPTSQNTGKPVQINCNEDFQKIDVVWGDSDQIETIVKTGTTIVGYHIYNNAGSYIVHVTAYNTYGYSTKCQCTISITGDVNPVTPEGTHLSISAIPSYGKPPLEVAFSYIFSADDGATAKSVSWEFGDGNESTQAGPHNTYMNEGTYSVKCSVTDTKNRVCEATTTIVVKTNPTPDPGNQPPVVTITSDKITVDVTGTVRFTATASDPDGSIASYEWVAGDSGSTSGSTIFDHLYYNTAGATYDAYCIVTDNKGATAQSNIIKITVKPNEKPVVMVKVNGVPEGSSIPDVNVGDTISVDLCSSYDNNVGDSVSIYKAADVSGKLDPNVRQSIQCTKSFTALSAGTVNMYFAVQDTYGEWSYQKARNFVVKTPVQCKYAGYQVSKTVFNYSTISWNGCLILPDLTKNNPGLGYEYKKAACFGTVDPDFIVGSDQAFSGGTIATWTVKVLGTDCNSGDTLPVYTVLENAKSGDTNSNQEIVNVIVGQNYNFTVNINSQQSGIRTWRFYVSGESKYYNTLRNDVQ